MPERERAELNMKALEANNKMMTILIAECVDAYLENGAKGLKIAPKELIKEIVGVYF
jgi:hypothetical protein